MTTFVILKVQKISSDNQNIDNHILDDFNVYLRLKQKRKPYIDSSRGLSPRLLECHW